MFPHPNVFTTKGETRMSKSVQNRWTQKEVELLRTSNGMEEMKRNIPNKSERQIRSKAGKLRVSVAKNNWSNDQVEYLIKNYKDHGATKIANKLNKKPSEVRYRANKLGLKYIPPHQKVDKDIVIDMYVEKKISIEEIANSLNVHYEFIRKMIPEKYKGYRRTDIDSEELVEKYNSGIGTTLLAREYETHPGVVRDILMRNGVVLRNQEDTWDANTLQLPIYQIEDLYRNGFSLRDIGSLFDISMFTVRDRLVKRGVSIRKDISFYNSGHKNRSWKGGVTPKNALIRESKEYKEWRLAVFKRDNYICQCCDDDSGGNLMAHHILNFAEHINLRFETSNGVTMCDKCHAPQIEGSFHHTYGTTNNDIYQLQEYFDDIRSHLGLELVDIDNIIKA